MTPGSKRAARLVCALAVLIGLFGMHGLATAQAGGCHADETMVSAPSITASMAPSMATSMATSMAVDTVAMTTEHRMLGTMAGASCLFVPPSGWPVLALLLLGLVGAAGWQCAGRRWTVSASGRSPPSSGVSLLRRVCVSRT